MPGPSSLLNRVNILNYEQQSTIPSMAVPSPAPLVRFVNTNPPIPSSLVTARTALVSRATFTYMRSQIFPLPDLVILRANHVEYPSPRGDLDAFRRLCDNILAMIAWKFLQGRLTDYRMRTGAYLFNAH